MAFLLNGSVVQVGLWLLTLVVCCLLCFSLVLNVSGCYLCAWLVKLFWLLFGCWLVWGCFLWVACCLVVVTGCLTCLLCFALFGVCLVLLCVLVLL